MICLLVILSMTLSGTVAKYVTSGGDFSDSARVAKWGVTVSTGSDLKSSYEKEGTGGVCGAEEYPGEEDEDLARQPAGDGDVPSIGGKAMKE